MTPALSPAGERLTEDGFRDAGSPAEERRRRARNDAAIAAATRTLERDAASSAQGSYHDLLTQGRLDEAFANPNHDNKGRFAPHAGGGASAPSSSDATPGENLRPLVPAKALMGGDLGKGWYAVEVQTPAGKTEQVRMEVSSKVTKAQRPTDEEIQRTLTTVADVYERAPHSDFNPPSVRVISKSEALEYNGVHNGTYAFTIPSRSRPADIFIIGRQGLQPRKMNDQHFMQNSLEGTVAHEYGHLHDTWVTQPGGQPKRSKKAMLEAVKAMPNKGGMKRYGLTHPDEAYAETFSDWAMTNGKSTVPATRAYAEAFHW